MIPLLYSLFKRGYAYSIELMWLVLNNLTLKEHFEVKRSLEKPVSSLRVWMEYEKRQETTKNYYGQQNTGNWDEPWSLTSGKTWQKNNHIVTLLLNLTFVYKELATMTIVVHTMVLNELNEVPGANCFQNMNFNQVNSYFHIRWKR